MRSVTLTVVSIVLFAFTSNTVSALPVAPSHLVDGNVDAAATNGVSYIDKRGLLGDLTRGILDGDGARHRDAAKAAAIAASHTGGGGAKQKGDAAKAAAKDPAKKSASSIQKRGGLLSGFPVVGDLLGSSKPKKDGNTAQAAGSTGSEETIA